MSLLITVGNTTISGKGESKMDYIKPDIVKWYFEKVPDGGYIGVICKCGRNLYAKNKPENALLPVTIQCPCGFEIQTIYERDWGAQND